MSHKHCVFCGEELPVPRPTSWSSVCTSPINTTQPDTVGNRHHAFFVGHSGKPIPVAKNFHGDCLDCGEELASVAKAELT